jgi:hypothetical protein
MNVDWLFNYFVYFNANLLHDLEDPFPHTGLDFMCDERTVKL